MEREKREGSDEGTKKRKNGNGEMRGRQGRTGQMRKKTEGAGKRGETWRDVSEETCGVMCSKFQHEW